MAADKQGGQDTLAPHVAPWKKTLVDSLVTQMSNKTVVGVVNIEGIPANQIRKIRANLKKDATFIVSKNSLMKLALLEVAKNKKGIEKMVDDIDGQCGVIMTDIDPFKLHRTLEDTKTKAPAKGGEPAPDDIIIEKGDTPFKPGPIVGDLQKAGIPAAIEGGKIVIKTTKTLVKAGEPIPKTLAPMLTKLDIFPLTLGLDLRSAYEDGTIYGKDILAVDVGEYLQNISHISKCAFNLAMNINYITKQTVVPMIQIAQSHSMNLALNASIVNSETARILLSKAHAQMLALASGMPDGLDDELKSMISARPAQPKKDGSEEKKDDNGKTEEKKEEKEEVSEEEAASGLGALFG